MPEQNAKGVYVATGLTLTSSKRQRIAITTQSETPVLGKSSTKELDIATLELAPDSVPATSKNVISINFVNLPAPASAAIGKRYTLYLVAE